MGGFWDVEEREKKLAKQNDLLLRLDCLIPWEEFRPILSKIHEKDRKNNYQVYQTSGLPIGSGDVESTVKVISTNKVTNGL